MINGDTKKIRNMIKLPTEVMLADGLTKIKYCPVLLDYLASGWWNIPYSLSSHIVVKGPPSIDVVDERALIELDE